MLQCSSTSMHHPLLRKMPVSLPKMPLSAPGSAGSAFCLSRTALWSTVGNYCCMIIVKSTMLDTVSALALIGPVRTGSSRACITEPDNRQQRLRRRTVKGAWICSFRWCSYVHHLNHRSPLSSYQTHLCPLYRCLKTPALSSTWNHPGSSSRLMKEAYDLHHGALTNHILNMRFVSLQMTWINRKQSTSPFRYSYSHDSHKEYALWRFMRLSLCAFWVERSGNESNKICSLVSYYLTNIIWDLFPLDLYFHGIWEFCTITSITKIIKSSTLLYFSCISYFTASNFNDKYSCVFSASDNPI